MNLQTGTIKLTGLRPEVLLWLDEQARAAEMSVENYLRMRIELEFTPHRIEVNADELMVESNPAYHHES